MNRHLIYLLPWLGLAAVAACGGRNLEDSAPELIVVDDDDGGVIVGGGGSAAVGGAGGGGGITGGAAPGGTGPGAGGPIDCFGCLGAKCPSALACITNPDCIAGITCAVTNCLAGGNPDPICLADCFGGDIGAALEAFEVITCVLGQCMSECGDLLPIP